MLASSRRSGRGSFRKSLLLLIAALALLAAPARAHEMSMAEMEVRETGPGEFLWHWSAANDKRPMGDDLMPRWPNELRHCARTSCVAAPVSRAR